MKPPRFFTLTVVSVFFIIVVLPILYMVASPFWAGASANWQGYAVLFDARHLTLATNSLALATGATCLCLVIGIPLAFLIQRTNLWGRAIFGKAYIIPILIPPYIHAIVWTHLNPFIGDVFALEIHSLWGGILVLTLSYFPVITLMTLSGLKSIDRNLEEASLLVRGRLHAIRRITLPLVTPHVLSGATFVFIFSIIDFAVPDILRVKVYPVEIFVQFSAFFDEGAATLLSVPLITMTLFLIVLQKWHMKNRSYVQISGGHSKTARHDLGWLNIPALGFCFIILGLSVGLPLAVLLDTAGALSNYVRALSTSWNQIGYSLVLSASGALFCLVLAFSLSYLFERTQMKMKTTLELVSFVPLAIPAITLGIGLIKVWNQPMIDVIYSSPSIIVFGYVARFLPFSVVAVGSGFKQASPQLEEVAHLTSPHWARVMRRIVVPLLRPSLITGFFIVFILSLGELGTTLLVIPPGKETLPIKIYNLMHYGAEQIVAALCVSQVAMLLAFSGLFLILQKKLAVRKAG